MTYMNEIIIKIELLLFISLLQLVISVGQIWLWHILFISIIPLTLLPHP